MKNAIATLRITLNIPDACVASIAQGIDCDPADEDHYQPILEALESEIDDDPSHWLQYETSLDIEVDG